MKTKQIVIYLLAGLVICACSKEDRNDPSPPHPDGEKSTVNLVISGSAGTRGADSNTQSLGPGEGDINAADGIKVYVFNQEGWLDYASPTALTLTQDAGNNYVSEAFVVTNGPKYFYVFVNDGAGLITAPTSVTSMDAFMTQVINVSFNATGAPSITGTNFLMGTLWKESVMAPSGGTSTTPQSITLDVGRLVSKINLQTVELTVVENLKGTFSDPKYRIGTIPKKINSVGVHEGASLPTTSNVLVTSAVHELMLQNGVTDANYLDYMPVWNDVTESFYATENTAKKDAVTGQQYFGNTTYIQLETVYAPDASEIFDPKDLSPGTLQGATFWTAKIVDEPTDLNVIPLAGQTIILSSLPVQGDVHADIVWSTNFPEYTDGKNYHKFPIFDHTETLNDEIRNRVLRNHYYEFTVEKFVGLGSADKDVDPGEPIPSKTTVNVTVKVLDWNKVTGTTPVG